jgi:hypothetical protein
MKIAVCLSGQIRTGLECADNIIHFFKSSCHHIDFFIHTWDTTSSSPFNCIEVYPSRIKKVNKYTIDKLLTKYNPKGFKIENHDKFLKKHLKYRDVNKINSNDLEKNYSFYKSITLKKIEERKNNFKYDYVIKFRMDCVLLNPKILDSYIEELNKNKNGLITYYNYDINWKEMLELDTYHDLFYMCNSENMNKYSNFYLKELKIKKEEVKIKEKINTQYKHTIECQLEPIILNNTMPIFIIRDFCKNIIKDKKILKHSELKKMFLLNNFYYNEINFINYKNSFIDSIINILNINRYELFYSNNIIYLEDYKEFDNIENIVKNLNKHIFFIESQIKVQDDIVKESLTNTITETVNTTTNTKKRKKKKTII